RPRLYGFSQFMNKAVTVTSEFDVRHLFDDVGLAFANRPLYRITFDVETAAVQRLTERFQDRVFRSCHRAGSQGRQLETVLFRFDDDTFVLAMGDYRQRGEVYAATAERAEAVYRELGETLREIPARRPPSFYMLRQDCDDISTEEV